MKTEAQIHFNFANARARANELDEAADALQRKCVKGMESVHEDLSGGWRGDSANRFTQKMMWLQGDIQQSVMELQQIAGMIRKNAQIIFDAEMEALRIARENM